MRHGTQNPLFENRLFAACGIGSVILELAGVGIGALGGRPFVTITSSQADVRAAFAKPVSDAAWVGAYMELLSVGLFLAFALWACSRLGGGLPGSIAGAAATGYATLTIVALGIGDAAAYRAGHGIDVQLATTLVVLNEAIYVCTWFLSAFFLLAAAPMALAAGRRVMGWSAIGIPAVIFATTALSLDDFGQMSNLLWLAWIVGTSISLARSPRAVTSPSAVALA
jgi:hypothetical protein